MKTVVHKCPNCKANLNLKEGATSGVCDFCRAPFTIDDGVIHIEHTVEITDDTSLKVANTTLYKFKEYEESEILFRRLLFKYGHKPEVYIGLILSITHDFTKEMTTIPAMNEINELWERFVSIGKDKDIKKYKDNVTKYNCDFWLNNLVNYTDNFKNHKTKTSLKVLDYLYNNYTTYCSKEEKSSIQTKYNKFRKLKDQYDTKRKNIIRFSVIGIIILILVSFFINYIILINEKIVVKNESIKISDYINYCNMDSVCSNYSFILDNFEDTKSNLSLDNIVINKEDLRITFDAKLKNKFKEVTSNYTFKLVDDIGPVIESNNCSYTDTENVDVYNCFTIYDYKDGIIDTHNANVNLENIDFKTIGTKDIVVEISDSDSNLVTKNIQINIVKSDISVSVKTNKSYVEINTTDKLSYSISPDVLNKSVTYEYDSKYISFDENTKTIKGLKVGTSQICVIPEYDTNKKTCKDIRVTAKCKSTYTFKYDGSDTDKLVAGDDFCPGKYKIYAGVLNKKNSYYIYLKDANNKSMDTVLIWKDAYSLSDEGNKYSFALDSTINVPAGVTSVKLVKTK